MNKSLKGLLLTGMIFTSLFFSHPNAIWSQEYHGGASMPIYKGGNKALKELINNNLNFPDSIKMKGISGTVVVKLTINKDGKVEKIKLMKGIYPVCDAEAIRVAGLLTDWMPANNWGLQADCNVLLPIEFKGENRTGKVSFLVSGKVCEMNTGNPISHAFIFVKNTTIGTLTDEGGNYTLEIAGDSYDMEISFIGFNSKTEHIGNNRTINVELEKSYCLLDYNSGE